MREGRGLQTYLRIWDLDVAPPSVDHVSLSQHAHLRFVRGEADEAEALRLARFRILLHLRHQHLAERLEVLAQVLFGGLPRQPQHNQVGAAQFRFHSFRFGRGVFQIVVRLSFILCKMQ